MSEFTLKPEKIRQITEIRTLDETHKKIMSEFQKKKKALPKKKLYLEELKNKLNGLEVKDGKLYTNKDIQNKSKWKTIIEDLEDEIYDIENDISEINYYSKTDDLLMNYYDILNKDDDNLYEINPELSEIKIDKSQEKLNTLDILNKQKRTTHKKIVRKRKKKYVNNPNNNIMKYFNYTNKDGNKIEFKDNIKDRSELLNQFRMLVDNEFLNESLKKNILKKCSNCNIDKILNQSEGIYVCKNCGEVEMIIIESERPNYKDIVPEKPGYPYKRMNHFNECLSQFQAKESTEIPKKIYDKILLELHKNRIYDFTKLTIPYMKQILKKLDLSKYYEHVAHIMSKLSKKAPPTINRDVEEKLRHMFTQVNNKFDKHCPKSRVNFLSYSYVLHKFFELLEMDNFMKCFPLLKSREKLRELDDMWKNICADLRWQFIPSI